MQQKTREEAERELLQASLMGDIREDIQFLGLTMGDIGWIVLVTLTVGGFPFILSIVLPIFFLLKIIWFVLVFLLYTAARYLEIPYRWRRWIRYTTTDRTGKGEDLPKLLGVEPEGWLYRGGTVWQMVLRVDAPPWQVAELNEKRSRLASFEQFLRMCVKEKFEVSIISEQLPDYHWELWQSKRESANITQGLSGITGNRLQRFEELAHTKQALKSEYILRLAIQEHVLNIRERDDEPQGVKKDELRRFRLITDLRERIGILACLG